MKSNPMSSESATRTLSRIYAAVEADDNLMDDQKEMFAEIASGLYRRMLGSGDALVISVPTGCPDWVTGDLRALTKKTH